MKQSVMKYFEELSAIPRVSGNEAAAADYVEGLAREKGYEVHRDDIHNIVVIKPASPGCETADTVMLQGHLDMVGVAKSGVEHDFSVNPIRLVRDADILRGDGTTLGADDGVAVAYILAILADDTLVHARLECVLTTQEETGLIGAQALDKSNLKATRMINLDAGPEGVFLATCAGGCHLRVCRDSETMPVQSEVWQLNISGLKGGHSGTDMQDERANALVLAGLVTDVLRKEGARLISVEGGDKDNVIPSSASLMFAIQGNPEPVLETMRSRIVETWQASDGGVILEWHRSKSDWMLDEASANAAIDLLLLMPNGVMSNSTFFHGLPESSANLAAIKADAEGIELSVSLRSSADLRKEQMLGRIRRVAVLLGANVELVSDYPGWAYEPNSPLRDVCVEVYEELYDTTPSVEGIHAGLECGVFKGAMPWLDIVATGPLYKEMHTPDEWLDISSFERTYTFLVTLLKKLCD